MMAQAPYRHTSWSGVTIETDQCGYCLAVDGGHAEECELREPTVPPSQPWSAADAKRVMRGGLI